MLSFKGWVRTNALRLSRASIYIEDTTTSTCWGSKCLWSQLFSFLLNLWAPPLVAIGTCETQGLRETMTLLRGLLGGSQGQALGGSRTKTSHSRQSVMLGCQNGCAQWQLSVQIIKGKIPYTVYNSTTPIVLILVSGDSWGIALTLWGYSYSSRTHPLKPWEHHGPKSCIFAIRAQGDISGNSAEDKRKTMPDLSVHHY